MPPPVKQERVRRDADARAEMSAGSPRRRPVGDPRTRASPTGRSRVQGRPASLHTYNSREPYQPHPGLEESVLSSRWLRILRSIDTLPTSDRQFRYAPPAKTNGHRTGTTAGRSRGRQEPDGTRGRIPRVQIGMLG